MTECPCANPRCHRWVILKPIRTPEGEVEPAAGLCRSCWRRVSVDRRHLLRRALLELSATTGLAQIVAWCQAWELCLMQLGEADSSRRAA